MSFGWSLGRGRPQDPGGGNNPIRGFAPHPYLSVRGENFSLPAMNSISVAPSCLKRNGLELIALDPGHDDSNASRRSDAKVRGGNGRYVFLWPEVHEGRLNQVVSWLVYDLLMKDPRLNAAQRDELQTMIRFSRHPGETQFGQYEKSASYSSSSQGSITSGVTNRRNRVNFMMLNHREYDSNRSNNLSTRTQDVRSKTLFLSVHANSSEFYNSGDHIWIIPPRGQRSGSENQQTQLSVIDGMARHFGGYFRNTNGEPREIASMKRDLQRTANKDNIRRGQHSQNLAMLRSGLGTSQTVKLLLEGFVMNGKAGNIAHREITRNSNAMKLHFSRANKHVRSYDVSNVYITYARSIAQGISDQFGCP